MNPKRQTAIVNSIGRCQRDRLARPSPLYSQFGAEPLHIQLAPALDLD